MQSRRVGTLTLGIVLILVGIFYLLINFFNIPIDVTIIKCWPIVLISLGVEVLIYNHYSVKENTLVKFDGVSIFLIMVLLVFSFGLYIFGRLSVEFLDPSSPLFYRKHIEIVSYIVKSIAFI